MRASSSFMRRSDLEEGMSRQVGHEAGSLARNSGVARARALVDRGLNRRQSDLWI